MTDRTLPTASPYAGADEHLPLGTRFAIAIALLGLTLTTLGPVYSVRFHLLGGFTGPWEDDPFVVAVFTATYVAVLAALAVMWRPGRRAIAVSAAPLVLCMLAMASVLWAEVGALSGRRALLFLGTTALGILLGALLDPRRMTMVIATTMTACTLASGLVAIAWPGTGLQSDGDWAGIYFNRNSLAPVAALSVLSLLCVAITSRRASVRAAVLVCAGASGLVLLRTGGRTAQVALIVSALVLGFALSLPWLRRRGTAMATVAVVTSATIAVALFLIWALRDRLLDLADRGSDLENRVPLWGYVVDRVSTRPVGGFGFYGYWSAPNTAYDTFQALRWVVPTAHNGFLETALGLGLAGAALLLVGIGVAAAATFVAAWRGNARWAAAPMAFLAFGIASNLAESFVLPNQFIWVVVVASGVAASTQLDALGRGPGTEVRRHG